MQIDLTSLRTTFLCPLCSAYYRPVDVRDGYAEEHFNLFHLQIIHVRHNGILYFSSEEELIE